MTKTLLSMMIAICVCLGSLQAQVIVRDEIIARGEIIRGYGYSPKTLESLIGTSAIIVKGRFGKFVKSELFYGFGNSREAMIRIYGYSEQEADEIGLPVSDYEILVDEVLLGDPALKGSTILYRLSEIPQDAGKFQDPNIDRLFFLVRNPDNSFTATGPANIQNDRDGSYSYDSLAAGPEQFTGRSLSFINDSSTEAFTNLVKNEISRVYSH
ncbi:MAG: hypothetical protein Q8N34_05995 [Gammaproteobacteria bacterium]|nr:hypothetical protein [Gammaproteobacteria bacterium]